MVVSLQTWLRVQASLWLPALAAVATCGVPEASSAWRHAGIALMGLSLASLVGLLRAGRTAADAVTVVRGAGLILVAALSGGGIGWIAWTAAVAVVLLDLVDGAIARRFGGSATGAVLDMETDQLTVLVLALLAAAAGTAAWVLLLPAMRYAFVLAAWRLRIPAHEPKPVNGDNRRGRLVCAAVMAALLAAICPPTPRAVAGVVTAVAVLLLAWSFAGDARFLLAHRRGEAAA